RPRQRRAATPRPCDRPAYDRPGLAATGLERRSAGALRSHRACGANRSTPPRIVRCGRARVVIAFDKIQAAAVKRLGGDAALAARLPSVSASAELRRRTDDRYLSLMSQRIFRAGLRYSLVDAKWPAFEDVFHGFELRRVRAMNDEETEALMNDRRLIRHWGKIKSVRGNAAAMLTIAAEGGSFGAYLADWPGAEVVRLWDDIAKRFQQMGGNSGPMFLRMAGKDTFILTHSVMAALSHWGALTGTPKSKTARAQVQAVFN